VKQPRVHVSNRDSKPRKKMTRAEWKRWREKVNEIPEKLASRRDPKGTSGKSKRALPPRITSVVQGGAPGMGKKHGKRR